jgi:hypothetical protein
MIDYDHVFAPVGRSSTVRLFFSAVAFADLECHMIDIENASIQGEVDFVIYMSQPPGFHDGTGNVLKMLYGLKRAPRVWSQTLTAFLLSIGCIRSQSYGALFTLSLAAGAFVCILVFVDDILIASAHLSDVQFVQQQILSAFKGSAFGTASYFLQVSIEPDRNHRLLVLRQQRHVEQLVQAGGLCDQGSKGPADLPDRHLLFEGPWTCSEPGIQSVKVHLKRRS